MSLVLAISCHRRDHLVRKRGAQLIFLFRTKIDQDLDENRTIKIKDHNRMSLFKYLSAIKELDTQDSSQKKQQLEARRHSLHSFTTSQESPRTKTGLPPETRCKSTTLLETASCRTNYWAIWIENPQVTSWLLDSLDFLLHVGVSAHNTRRLEFLEIPKIAIAH